MNIYNFIDPIRNKYLTTSHKKGISKLENYINKLGGSDLSKSLLAKTGENIHLLENHIIRDAVVELIFYNPHYRYMWDKNYIRLVKNDEILLGEQTFLKWFLVLEDTNYIQLIKRVINPCIINPNEGKIDVTNQRFMMSVRFKEFLKYYNLPGYIEQNDRRVIDILKRSTPILKTRRKPTKIWDITDSLTNDNYVAIISIENKAVGICVSEVITEKELSEHLKDNYIPNSSFNLYIARVDIHPDYRDKGLCKPLVSYMIKQLKILGYKSLFINNASSTSNGVPACFCYFKAGINNDYTLTYNKGSSFIRMVEEDCKLVDNKLPRDYFYSL